MELLRNCLKKCLHLFLAGIVVTLALMPCSPAGAQTASSARDASVQEPTPPDASAQEAAPPDVSVPDATPSDASAQGAIPPGGPTQGATPPEAASPAATPPVDLVFVIDNSGSMRKNDPKSITPKVVSTFVDQLPENAHVGMVRFDQEARLLIPMTPLANPKDRRKVIDSLRKIDYRGQFTNTPIGIERALYELKTDGRKASQKGIIFITDGIVDTGDPAKDRQLTQWLKKDVAASCKQEGVRIFGIALTEQADFSLIQALAARTDGEYFRTFAADEISGVLQQIRTQLNPVKAAPVAELAPLQLLPIPVEEESKPVATAKEAAAQSAPAPQPGDNGTVVVSEKAAWTISIALAALVLVLLGALIFFFFQNSRRRQVVPAGDTGAAKDLNIPEAYIEDQGEILGKGKSPFVLDREIIKIGRGKKNDLVIDAPAISGFHATIEFRNMSFYLEDQRSTNGTMLNDRRLEANHHVRLKDGDRITFATYPFLFNSAEKSLFGDPVMLGKTALEDKEAEATIVLDLDGVDTHQGLISCIQTHLMHIYSLSANHKNFVNTYFTHDILEIIATTAHENLQKTMKDNQQYCTSIPKNNSLYVVCSLPGAIDMAAKWYGMKNNGFTQFLFKWVRSEAYTSAKCDQLCMVTFGQDPATWVSITVVPTHSRPDPIEIMSVDFLNDEEKASLALDFDHHGRVI
jgi:pSer/pThr/pTyr-binding forkhead associated (FHA) protein/Mg-chelatase subunit ChlD